MAEENNKKFETSEDTVKYALSEYSKKQNHFGNMLWCCGVLISLMLTIATAEFKATFGISAEIIQATFYVLTFIVGILSLVFLVLGIISRFKLVGSKTWAVAYIKGEKIEKPQKEKRYNKSIFTKVALLIKFIVIILGVVIYLLVMSLWIGWSFAFSNFGSGLLTVWLSIMYFVFYYGVGAESWQTISDFIDKLFGV